MMKKIISILLILLLGMPPVMAVDIFYSLAGNDTTGNGSSGNPYRTIGKAISVANAGDNIRLSGSAGLFNERVAVTRSGSSGSYINIIGQTNVICRGFDLTDVSYVNIINFDIQHTNLTTYSRGIRFINITHHIGIYKNRLQYIHDENIHGVGTPTYITIRGNLLYYINAVPNVATNVPDLGIGAPYLTPHHWVLEYNNCQRMGDFMTIYGTNNIYRNNYLADYQNAYWPSGGAAWHSDMFQPGSDGADTGAKNQVYEANYVENSETADSHFGIWQDTVSAGDTNFVVRGNITSHLTSGAASLNSDKLAIYNNTWYWMAKVVTAAGVLVWYGAGLPQNGLGINNIISEYGGTDAINPQDGVTTVANNLGYHAGSESSYVSTSDPLFTDTSTGNFALQSGSPARAAGRYITQVTSSNGSGTSFDVADGKLLLDGWGIVEGDLIRVGSTNATQVRITSISGNTITVSASIPWNNGDNVYWKNHGLDIGGLPFYFTPLTSAPISNVGTTYTVSPNGDTRMVVFSVDDIPQAPDYDPPYQITSSGVVTAEAFPLYAQKTNVIVASQGGSTPATGATVRTPITLRTPARFQ